MELPTTGRQGDSHIETAIRAATEGYHRGRTLHNRATMALERKRRDYEVGAVSEARFDRILDSYRTDTVFVHVGLRDISRAFEDDPYEFLLGRLDERFESILNPGFTPTFRSIDGGIYHKQYSVPKFGAFSRLFLEDCDYRTDDPTNSILVRGPYRFDDCRHDDTWAAGGCFEKLDRENVRYLNVGTDWLRSSHIHYLESRLNVPYIETIEYEGVIYREDGTYEPITHRSHEYTMDMTWNRTKILEDLEGAGVLDSYDLNGLKVFAFRARDIREVLTPKILADPYYLVT